MSYRVTLAVRGVDLGDDVVVGLLAGPLAEFAWHASAGRTLVTLESEAAPIAAAVKVARLVTLHLPAATVEGVDEEFVSVSDIARRLGVGRETVRSWVTGDRGPGGFPAPRGTVGGGDRGASRIWDWAAVNRWLDETWKLGDGYRYLTPTQMAEVNAEIHQVYKRTVDQEIMNAFTRVFEQWEPRLTPSTVAYPVSMAGPQAQRYEPPARSAELRVVRKGAV
jgi:hypothetical protein